MTDVYASMGIPMPPNPDADEVDEKSNPENAVAEPSPWEKRVEEDRDRDLRLECVRIAFGELNGTSHQLINSADRMFKFVKSGETSES